MGRLVHQREFLAFKNETESDIVNLKLDRREIIVKLDALSCDFNGFKDRAMGYFDSLFSAVSDIRVELELINKALASLEEKVERIEKWEEKINKIDKIDGIENRVDAIENGLDKIEGGLDKIEQTLQVILTRLPARKRKR